MFPHMYRVRHRKNEDGGSTEDIGKPEWQTDGWRRNSKQWPPSSDSSQGGQQPLLRQASSTSNMQHSTPSEEDPNMVPGSAIPGRLNRRARSNSPAVPQKVFPPVPSTPKDRILQEETGLKVPAGGRSLRARSSSPYGNWANPGDKTEHGTSSPASASPLIRRRRPVDTSENADTGSGSQEESEVRLQGVRLPRQRPRNNSCPNDRRRGVEVVPPYQEPNNDIITAPDKASLREEIPEDLSHISEELPRFSRDLPPIPKDTPPIPSDFNRITKEHPQNNEDLYQISENVLRSNEETRSTTPSANFPSNVNGMSQDQTEKQKRNLHFEVADRNGDIRNEGSDQKPSAASPEVASQWADLIDEALLTHTDDQGEDADSSKNAFFQKETNPALFQGSTASYIPASKQEFLQKQQEKDQEYILNALDQEKENILQPIMKELDQMKQNNKSEEQDGRDHLTVNNKTSSNEEEDDEEARAWSPGPPIFKNDIQQLKPEDIGERWWEMEDPKKVLLKKEGSVPKAPPPPGPPAPPPMPFKTKVDPSAAIPKMRKAVVENIKKAVRTRPDWRQLMHELEGGIKLKKVDATKRNDRSQPILPGSRGRNGKFVYDSEKPTIVNELLHEIQRGVQLRKTKTNDRSKPDFNRLGLKKIRRQVTVEEKKRVKPEDPEALPSSSDEDEDIDHMRDDLDAVRTQLNDEIKKTKKLEREKKVMKIDIEALQAEVKKMKRQLKEAGIQEKPLGDGILPKLEKSMSKLRMCDKDDLDMDELDTIETEIKELNNQIDVQKKRAEGLEHKVYEMEQKLKISEGSSDEWEGRAIFFEKKFKALQKDHGIALPDIAMASVQTDDVTFFEPEEEVEESKTIDSFGAAARKSGSRRSFASQINRMESFQEEEEEESSSSSESEYEEEEVEEEEETIAEGDSDAETDEEKVSKRAANEAKRLERDRVYWSTKLDHIKEKEANIKKERENLRERIKKFYRDMYKERVEFLKTKSELDELVKQLRDPDEIEEEEEEEEEAEEEEPENHDDDPGWWFDNPNLKPKKLKKKKKKKQVNGEEGEEELEEEEEDLEDLDQLEEPHWSDSEGDESEPDDENDSLQVRVNFLQSRSKKHEQKMNAMKKENYVLKSEAEKCKEKHNEEKIRKRRLEEELNMLLSDMQ